MNENLQEARLDPQSPAETPIFQVASSPHLSDTAFTTRRMMMDVLIALIPLVLVAVVVFQMYAVKQLLICLVSCLVTEALFTRMRGRPIPIADGSAAITGLILALSLPGTAPWYIGVIASVIGIGIGKIIFGGLGMNIFNPAMVGRAFVMISFAGAMAAGGYIDAGSTIDAMTMATPLTAAKAGQTTSLFNLFIGATNGSLGEVSALACLVGGLFLCLRRTASWEIPAGIILATSVCALLATFSASESNWGIWHHLSSGALLFGAFFIATDPVTSPLTPKGKFVFGLGVGALVMLLRLFSGYPEGVMFAVLFMNALTPLINRWTIPRQFGQTSRKA